MATALPFTNTKKELRFPKMATFYDHFAQPLAWLALRFTVGAALIIQGIPLVMDPLSMKSFLEGIGLFPGHVWSPLLMMIQVLGGILIVIGLFTRPAALVVATMLLVTLWYHLAHPFGTILVTEKGLEALTSTTGMMTKDGYLLLSDGGLYFTSLAQSKAVMTSLLWSGAALLFAAFGGGYLSLDRRYLRKRY